MKNNKRLCQLNRKYGILKLGNNSAVYIDEWKAEFDRKGVKVWNCNYGKRY